MKRILKEGDKHPNDSDDDFDPEMYSVNPHGHRTQKSIDDEYRKLGFD